MKRCCMLALLLALLPLSAAEPALPQVMEQLEMRLASAPDRQHRLRLRLLASLTAISEGESVNRRDERGYTALMLAAQAGEAQAFHLLLERGADSLLPAPGGVTLTMLAAQGGNEEIFRSVLAGRSIPARATDQQGTTLFQHACMGGNLRICSAILHAGGNAFTRDRFDHTSLMYAAMGGNESLFYELINRGAELHRVGRDGMTLLHAAARGGSAALVRTALDIGISPNAADGRGNTPLMEAARCGPDEAVALMLARGGDPTRRDRAGATAAMYAAASGHTRAYDMLGGSAHEAPDAQGRTPLLYAISGGDVQLVRRMLREGADPTVLQGAPLRFAKAAGRMDVTLEVAAHIPGMSPEAIKSLPIHSTEGAICFTRFLATRCNDAGDRELAATLLRQLMQARELGSPPDAIGGDSTGRTPLQNAVRGQFTALMNFLLAAGADVNAPSRSGRTALMEAVECHDEAVVQQLLAAGADVNAMSADGLTALKLAAAAGWTEMFELLINRGADPELNCPGGPSTLDCARAAGPEGRAMVKRLIGPAALPRDAASAYTALLEAMRGDDREQFDALLLAWPDANAADEQGRTLLMMALLDRVPEYYISTLLQRGADPNAADKSGQLPLHYVSTPRQRRLLIEAGAIP